MLDRITTHLMLNSLATPNDGLLNGRMGIAIYFFHLSRHTGRELYNEYANELVYELANRLHQDCPRDFANGLCGIAWGIEYIIQNKLEDADADELLSEVDQKILELDVRKVQDRSLYTGLRGIGYYLIMRCAQSPSNTQSVFRTYIGDLIVSIENPSVQMNEEDIYIAESLRSMLKGRKLDDSGKDLLHRILAGNTFNDEDLFTAKRPLGLIDNGFAGIGLKLLLNSDDETC